MTEALKFKILNSKYSKHGNIQTIKMTGARSRPEMFVTTRISLHAISIHAISIHAISTHAISIHAEFTVNHKEKRTETEEGKSVSGGRRKLII